MLEGSHDATLNIAMRQYQPITPNTEIDTRANSHYFAIRFHAQSMPCPGAFRSVPGAAIRPITYLARLLDDGRGRHEE